MGLTDYHAKYFAHELTRRYPSDSVEKFAGAVASAQVDLNPHQLTILYLAHWQTNTQRHSAREAGRVWERNCRYAGATIRDRIWARVWPSQPIPHGSLCRDIS